MISVALFLIQAFAVTWQQRQFVRDQVARIPDKTRVLVLSDERHRLPNTRALTLDIAQTFAERYPREKVCVTFETTPKVDEAWKRFEGDGRYEEHFAPLGEQIHANGLKAADAARIFVEPSALVAQGLRGLANVRVFGVDVDYTSEQVFRPLYENMNPPRQISDDEFARLFVGNRNEAMASKANALLRAGTCTRMVMSMGSAHARVFKGGDRAFPGYKAGPIPGVVERLDPAFAGKPFVIGLSADTSRRCPPECDVVSGPVQSNDLNLITPGNYADAVSVMGGAGTYPGSTK